MLYTTAGELIRTALHLSQTYNTTYENFATGITYLNNVYREIYSIICDEREDYNVYTYISKQPKFQLPDDFLILKRVMIKDGEQYKLVEKCPDYQMLHGTYTLENNTFQYFGQFDGEIVLKYCPIPKTLTYPAPAIPLSISPDDDSPFQMDDNYVYYRQDGKDLRVEYRTGLIEETNISTTDRIMFNDMEVEIALPDILLDGEPTEIFDREDKSITNIVFDGHYAMITYDDGLIFIHDGISLNEWNPSLYKGKQTTGKILALCTDDSTGYGCLYFDGKNYSVMSFVTDTVLDYPTNALFTYMQYKLAAIFSMLSAMENPTINNEVSLSRMQLMKELKRNRGSIGRIRNMSTGRRI